MGPLLPIKEEPLLRKRILRQETNRMRPLLLLLLLLRLLMVVLLLLRMMYRNYGGERERGGVRYGTYGVVIDRCRYRSRKERTLERVVVTSPLLPSFSTPYLQYT